MSLVAVAGYIMNQVVQSRMMTAMYMVAFQGGAIFLNFMGKEFEITPIADPETNLIVMSTIGMTVALLISFIVVRTVNFLINISQPKVERHH